MRRPRAPGNSRLEAAARFFVGITVVSVLTVAAGPRLVSGARRLVNETISYRAVVSAQDRLLTHGFHNGPGNALKHVGGASLRDDGLSASGGKSSARENTGGGRRSGESIHVIITSNGSPYLNWQSRIMYHSFQKVAKLPGSDMRFFTRVLHRASEDALMAEIPTVRVEPLDASCDTWCEYPVASRPSAIQQWLESGDPKGDWVLMAETDHLLIKPFSVPPTGRNLGFPFSYMAPQAGELRPYMLKFYDCPECSVKDIPPTGNAPVLMKMEDMRKVIPVWVDITARIESDEDAKKKLGWVREMYAFSIAVAKAGVELDLPKNPNGIMVQPPEDKVLGDAKIIHYTWGNFIKDERGNELWSWDKRKFIEPGLPPHVVEPPPDRATEVQSAWIRALNDAIDSMPRYCQGELDAMGPQDRAAAEDAAGKEGVV